MLVKESQMLFAAGVVDCFDFKISHNVASAEVELFLRKDLKDLRPFMLKRFLFFMDIKVNKGLNQPPRPGNEFYKDKIINCPGAIPAAWLFAKFAHWANS